MVIPAEDCPGLLQQLTTLGFKTVQARNAIAALSQASLIASVLLRSNPPLQACIEYLILQVPECDLPQRFLPSLNSSGSFVTSTHAGSDSLQIRWAEEKAIKECGWPAHVVKECMAHERLANNWELLVSVLNRRLIGDDWRNFLQEEQYHHSIGEDEAEAFGSYRTEDDELAIPMPIAPLKLVLVPSSQGRFRSDYPPALYVVSPSVPAYIRLYLTSKLLDELKSGSLPEEGESLVMGAVRLLEEEWVSIEDNGPPDMATILLNLIPEEQQDAEIPEEDTIPASGRKKRNGGRRQATRKQDERSDSRVQDDFTRLTASDKYEQILASRRKLPAFSAQAHFLGLLENNRCVVVVGETGKRLPWPRTSRGSSNGGIGCGKTTQRMFSLSVYCTCSLKLYVVPQFVLDSLILSGHGASASIIVTQPRRLSALGVAARVSAERLDDGSVGYAIRGESKQNQRTKLLFCTTGVVLRRLGSGDRLQDVTHVIVDEVSTQLCPTAPRSNDIVSQYRCMNVQSMATFSCLSSRACYGRTRS